MVVSKTIVCVFVFAITGCSFTDSLEKVMMDDLRTLCPYNSFCHEPAAEVLADEDDISCCAPCSCTDGCSEFNSCCPDKEDYTFNKQLPSCKTRAIKMMVFESDPKDGYQVVDSCPITETNIEVIEGCHASNMTDIIHMIWVSDITTGKVFQNQFCAECNGVTSFIHWHLRTDCLNALLDNFSVSLDIMVHSKYCSIIREIPKSAISTAEKYQCLVQDVSSCNETGLWENFNHNINNACDAFTMPYYDKRTTYVYKNVYCFICNALKEETSFPVCSVGDFRTSFSFSLLLDSRRYMQTTEDASDYNCEVEEIYDPYLDVCHQLHCPFGSLAHKGICKKEIFETEGLGILALYRLKIIWERSSVAVAGINESSISEIGSTVYTIVNKLFNGIGVECKACLHKLDWLAGNESAQLGDFVIYRLISTNAICGSDIVIRQMAELAGKQITVTIGQSETVELLFILEPDLDVSNSSFIARYYYYDQATCTRIYKVTSDKICPKIQLNLTTVEMMPTGKAKLGLLPLFLNDREERRFIEVCIKDYFAYTALVNEAPRAHSQFNLVLLIAFVCIVLIICMLQPKT